MIVICIFFCKSTKYDLISYISLIIKLNIINHMIILTFADYSYIKLVGGMHPLEPHQS